MVRFDSVQPRYNLLFRQIERELLPLCAEEGLGIIPYNPIAGGLLSGKHNPSAPPPEGTRFTLGNAAGNYQDRYWHDREFATVEELRKIAEREGVSLVTLSVAWVLANPAVTAPIIGASRPGQLEASLAAADLRHVAASSRPSSTSHPRLPLRRRRPLSEHVPGPSQRRRISSRPGWPRSPRSGPTAAPSSPRSGSWPRTTPSASRSTRRGKRRRTSSAPGLHPLHPRPGQDEPLPRAAGDALVEPDDEYRFADLVGAKYGVTCAPTINRASHASWSRCIRQGRTR